LGVEEFAVGGAAAVGVEEDVAGVLEEDRSVEVCWFVVRDCEREGAGKENGTVPEKQMIFRLVLPSALLCRFVVDMFFGVTAGGVIATGILKMLYLCVERVCSYWS
jgi:hypothetical protein